MTQQQWIEWINQQLNGLPRTDPYYTIGFLTAQLAQAASSDNYTGLRLKHTVQNLQQQRKR